MKKYFFFFLILSASMTACKKNTSESVFEEPADVRLNKVLTSLQSTLSGAENGWLGYLENSAGNIYTFYMRFNDKNRVTMYSDFNATTSSKANESSYRLKAMQQPALIFDTYSYIHLLADPNNAINGGQAGRGLNTDFEFAYSPEAQTSADTLNFLGRKKGSKLKLIKASKEVGDLVSANGYTSTSFNNISQMPTYFKRITLNGKEIEIRPDTYTKEIQFLYKNAAGIDTVTKTTYYLDPVSVVLTTPVVIDASTSIASFNTVRWNDADTAISFSINGTAVTVQKAIAPLFIENPRSANNWYNWCISSKYVSLPNSITVNGIADGFDLVSIPEIVRIDFYPKVVNSGTADYFRFWRDSSANSFGPAYQQPDFSTPGIAKFTLLGYVGISHITSSQSIINRVLSVNDVMTNPRGLYLIHISGTHDANTIYDMVAADNARVWMRWEY